MKKTEGNTMTVDKENRIIRKCDHVKSIGAMAVYGVPESKYDKGYAGE